VRTPVPASSSCRRPMSASQRGEAESTGMASSLAAAKQQLRSLMRQQLTAVPHESIASQSSNIFRSLLSFQPYVEAQRVSVFLSMPSGEVQTDAIVRHALAAGKQVFVPYLHKSPLAPPDSPPRVMDMVQLRDLSDYEALRRDRWGIPSIDPATAPERRRILGDCDPLHLDKPKLDLILMPGVAFDVDPESGLIRRCGHGRGFYDFFIHRYKSKSVPQEASPLLLYGLSLVEQFLPSSSEVFIPAGPLDSPLDGLILGDGEVKAGSNAK